MTSLVIIIDFGGCNIDDGGGVDLSNDFPFFFSFVFLFVYIIDDIDAI